MVASTECARDDVVGDERVASLVGSSCGLEEVIAAFDELLLLPDCGAVYAALAGIVANYAEGDVVWPLLVGPPGCGKSEIITALTSAPSEKHFVTEGAVSKWIKEARRRGYLPAKEKKKP